MWWQVGRRCGWTFVHRSTLKGRLGRIRAISGHDLADPETRFNLQLATRALKTREAFRQTDFLA